MADRHELLKRATELTLSIDDATRVLSWNFRLVLDPETPSDQRSNLLGQMATVSASLPEWLRELNEIRHQVWETH